MFFTAVALSTFVPAFPFPLSGPPPGLASARVAMPRVQCALVALRMLPPPSHSLFRSPAAKTRDNIAGADARCMLAHAPNAARSTARPAISRGVAIPAKYSLSMELQQGCKAHQRRREVLEEKSGGVE